ncbi:MAG: hypothetical protein SRB2_01899 [Desulfobacteraceae bacterium Eth-SRB2]|nr:MAG: hypothetical protein SRB2_01899 [Desulfobacteraceae bacterium Eth-SRB2]
MRHAEILNDINNGSVPALMRLAGALEAEAGGFGIWNPDTAYFTVDKTRGSDVVRRVILGKYSFECW